MVPKLAPIATAIAYTTIHIAAAVALNTPLPTVLFLDTVSAAASDQADLSFLSAAFCMSFETTLKSLGKRNARAPTVERRQKIAPTILLLKKNVTTAITAQIRPITNVDLLNLYSVSLLSKMMSLIDVFKAFKIALRGIRHSISTAPKITPVISAIDNCGISNCNEMPSPSTTNNVLSTGILIREYRTTAGMLPRSA